MITTNMLAVMRIVRIATRRSLFSLCLLLSSLTSLCNGQMDGDIQRGYVSLTIVCIYYCRLTTVFSAMSKPLCVAVVDRFFNHILW